MCTDCHNMGCPQCEEDVKMLVCDKCQGAGFKLVDECGNIHTGGYDGYHISCGGCEDGCILIEDECSRCKGCGEVSDDFDYKEEAEEFKADSRREERCA